MRFLSTLRRGGRARVLYDDYIVMSRRTAVKIFPAAGFRGNCGGGGGLLYSGATFIHEIRQESPQ
jgi:hypothetical protein